MFTYAYYDYNKPDYSGPKPPAMTTRRPEKKLPSLLVLVAAVIVLAVAIFLTIQVALQLTLTCLGVRRSW